MKNLYLFALLIIFQFSINAQTLSERMKYTANLDKIKIEALKNEIRLETEKNRKNISKFNFPVSFTDANQRFNHLQGVTDDGVPFYYQTDNNGCGVTIRASKLYSGGGMGLNIQGQNMIAGVWDGGAARLDHDHFQGRVLQKDFSTMALSAHATHVTGTICQNKTTTPISRGMAFNAEVWANDWTNDSLEIIDQATEGLLVSNHSYGFGALNAQNVLQIPLYYFGAYIQSTRTWDLVMNQFPNYLMVTSAGNDRDSQAFITNKGGYDLLSGLKACKNNIVVGAINNIPTYIDETSVVMSNFSNWGPTDDGRIKPDIVAKGVSVNSTTSTGGTATTATMSGTSMAAPSVTGGLLLLQQHYKAVAGNFMLASTLKGLALHTASEAGIEIGPDYEYGWGVLNCEAAANLITNRTTTTRIQELVLNPGQTITVNVATSGTAFASPLEASICWNDPAGTVSSTMVDNPAPRIINDLDIKITKNTTTFLPWRLNPTDPAAAATKAVNNVDPFEKVQILNATGAYSITITHKGTLQNAQNVSLIISGISQVLSANNYESENDFLVYPNPANSILNFTNFNNAVLSAVSIFDITGKEFRAVTNNNQIDITNLQSGVYFVKFSTSDAVITKKFIKI